MASELKRVYLCGPINGCTDSEATGWREWFKNQSGLQVEWVDPMRRDYRGRESECIKEIVEGDKADYQSCDALVVMYPRPSVGTSMEVHDAWSRRIPCVVVDVSGKPLTPWMAYHATVVVNSHQDAVRFLTDILFSQSELDHLRAKHETDRAEIDRLMTLAVAQQQVIASWLDGSSELVKAALVYTKPEQTTGANLAKLLQAARNYRELMDQ